MSDDLSPVYVVSYDHLGIILWKIEALEKVLNTEVERLERHPTFKVGWDHEAFTYDYLAEHEPALFEKMFQALRRFPGRLGVGSCTYGQPLSVFINEESNVRQLTLALDTVEEHLGVTPSVYLMSEHAMHSQLPQLLASCGFKGAYIRTHFMMYGYNPEIAEPVVWWTGLDGSRLPAVPTYPGGYALAVASHNPPFGDTTLDNGILTNYPNYKGTLEEFRHRFGKMFRPLVASRADDPRQNEEIIIAHEDDPDYTWMLADEVFAHLPQPRIDFRTAPNDFKVRMPWGFRGNWIWNRSRQAEVSVLTAERLAALDSALGASGEETSLKSSWKNLLVGQHHDVQIVGIDEDAHTYLDASLGQSSRVSADCMKRLAPRVGAKAERRRVVFNPLPWKRTDWVTLPEGGGFAADLPPLGFKAYPLAQGREHQDSSLEWNPQELHLRTAYYDLCLGKNGGFMELIERRTGQHSLMPGRPSGTLAGLIDGKSCESKGKWDIQVEGERVLLCESGMVGSIPYRSRWTFYADLPRIDWYGECEMHGERIGRVSEDRRDPYSAFEHEHKLRLRFYPRVKVDAVGVRDLPFAIAETPDRCVEGNYWTALSDGNVGLVLFNRGLMGSIREGDGAFSVPLAWSMFYIWDSWDGVITDEPEGHGRRFLKGTYRYELALQPFSGCWQEADLHRQALAYNFPCVAVQVDDLKESLGETWPPLQVGGDGAILSALYTHLGRTYARFYEYRGRQTEVSLQWLGAPARLKEVDLRERPLGDLGYTLPLGRWQVRTVELTGEKTKLKGSSNESRMRAPILSGK